MISLDSSVRELQVVRQALKYFINDQNFIPKDEEEALLDEINSAIREVEYALFFAEKREEFDRQWKEISKELKYFKLGEKDG